MEWCVVESEWGFSVEAEGDIIASVVRESFSPMGAVFVTPDSFSLQFAAMGRPAGHEILPHEHLPVPRALVGTLEVLVIISGVLRTDLYKNRIYLCSIELNEGDAVILNSGGHGFVAQQDCKFFEVKQGPFTEGKDKEIFASRAVSADSIRWAIT